MSTPIYSSTNYRKNLTLYWRQYFPEYEIPKGYHVHHIKPKCTFEDRNNPAIHHPKNLIALHPDDHISIHECRGDKRFCKTLLSVSGSITSEITKKRMSESWHNNRGEEYYKQLSTRMKGNKNPAKRPEVADKISKARTGQKWSPDEERMKAHKEKSSTIMNKNWSNSEFKEKMKNIHTGRKNTNETLRKMSEHQQSTYKLFNPNNKEFIIMSRDLKLFCKENKLGYPNIMRTKNKPGTKYKGWHMVKI